jgi:nitric oxide dioxygenase
LSNRPGLDYFRIGVKREPGSSDAPAGLVSNYLHNLVSKGDCLDIGPPCGEFTLDLAQVGDRPIVLISGGIGITPMMSMLESLAYHRVRTPVHFIHATRNSRHHTFANEVRRLAAECTNIRTHFCYDAPWPDDVQQNRCDSTGLIHVWLLSKLVPTNEAEFFLCGPKPFMVGVLRCLKQLRVADSSIHYEFFGPRQELNIAPAMSQTDETRVPPAASAMSRT